MKMLKLMKKRFIFIFLLFFVLLIVASGNNIEKNTTYNANSAKSIEALHIINKYNNLLDQSKPVFATSIDQVKLMGSSSPIKFIGQITGYGPDCEGCGGKVGCPPRPDVRNGNIYFTDKEYGKIRIVATDKAIPCGSIIKIKSYKVDRGEIYAIALDRGSAIQGFIVDLLFENEEQTNAFGRVKNAEFNIVRWGW